MGMFLRWKKKIQKKAQLEIALSKLEFLASEFVAGRDRKTDVYYWKTQLADANECSDDSVGVRKAIEAFSLLYQLYLGKHGFNKDLSLEEIVVSINQDTV
ncbi:hypothetical protein SMD22_01625 (plasmid) [Brevibacillus halotolerans]|nr:hypothetical protein SMD22_01625 [Brevibacillus halotolerans]